MLKKQCTTSHTLCTLETRTRRHGKGMGSEREPLKNKPDCWDKKKSLKDWENKNN